LTPDVVAHRCIFGAKQSFVMAQPEKRYSNSTVLCRSVTTDIYSAIGAGDAEMQNFFVQKLVRFG